MQYFEFPCHSRSLWIGHDHSHGFYKLFTSVPFCKQLLGILNVGILEPYTENSRWEGGLGGRLYTDDGLGLSWPE